MATDTPAPLTDEQIETARDALRDAWYSSPDERIPDRPFSLWLAAVIAKAKREERERLITAFHAAKRHARQIYVTRFADTYCDGLDEAIHLAKEDPND